MMLRGKKNSLVCLMISMAVVALVLTGCNNSLSIGNSVTKLKQAATASVVFSGYKLQYDCTDVLLQTGDTTKISIGQSNSSKYVFKSRVRMNVIWVPDFNSSFGEVSDEISDDQVHDLTIGRFNFTNTDLTASNSELLQLDILRFQDAADSGFDISLKLNEKVVPIVLNESGMCSFELPETLLIQSSYSADLIQIDLSDKCDKKGKLLIVFDDVVYFCSEDDIKQYQVFAVMKFDINDLTDFDYLNPDVPENVQSERFDYIKRNSIWFSNELFENSKLEDLLVLSTCDRPGPTDTRIIVFTVLTDSVSWE